MKLLVAVVCLVFFSAAHSADFNYEACIRMTVESSLTFKAFKKTETEPFENVRFDLGTPPDSITGMCAKASDTSASMGVKYSETITWSLFFLDTGSTVQLTQMVRFVPSDIFKKNVSSEAVSSSEVGTFILSARNQSFQCVSQLDFVYNQTSLDDITYTITQTMTNLQVQAFDLENSAFSPADRCGEDNGTTTTGPTTEKVTTTEAPTNATTTEAPTNATTTEAPTNKTTELPTTVAPGPAPPTFPNVTTVTAETFMLKDEHNVTCFLLKAGLQIVVEYKSNNTMMFSKPIEVKANSTTVTGSCTNGTSNAVMVINSTADPLFTLTITEQKEEKKASSTFHLKVMLDNATFPNHTDAEAEFNLTQQEFQQNDVGTYYLCTSLQKLPFEGSNTTLVANDVNLQAFNLANGSFTGSGYECEFDPKPTPSPTPNPPAGDNTFAVSGGNGTYYCIVLKGELTLNNISYTTKTGETKIMKFNIPLTNETSHNVEVTGNCNLTNETQELTITFNKNWNLTLTFAQGKSAVMLAATGSSEFSLTEIKFDYQLSNEFFPDTSHAGDFVSVNGSNLPDTWKGTVGGGSYKCSADQTARIGDGVELQTKNLQFKAFNHDNQTTFDDNKVAECSADDESNSIVPIAVGAALAGLVVIVLIAYLIGRKRSRRQGYESV